MTSDEITLTAGDVAHTGLQNAHRDALIAESRLEILNRARMYMSTCRLKELLMLPDLFRPPDLRLFAPSLRLVQHM